jgi:DNA-binding NtrC family response regulator
MVNRTTNLLITDDEKDFVEMLSLRLKASGLNVFSAFNGRECLDLIAQEDIDVVILDIKMPGMDGIETLREIKSRSPLVEVVMLTGHGTIDTAVEGMKLGAFDYVLKPAVFDDLREKIKGARQRKDRQADRIQKAEAGLLLYESRKGGRSPIPS